MPYLERGGARQFRSDTAKLVVSVGPLKKYVSGTNLVPIIEALEHYEGVLGFGSDERQKALCSIISRCRKWRQIKAAKAGAAADPNATVRTRFSVVTALMQEAVQMLRVTAPEVSDAFDVYSQRKERGRLNASGLAPGYATERSAYIAFDRQRSISGSLIHDLLESNTTRKTPLAPATQLAGKAKQQMEKKFTGRAFDELTVKEWQAIEKIAKELDGRRLETKYLTRHERLGYMLESDGNGGLRYAVGARSATTAAPSVWPYAMDEWGNIYTANDWVMPQQTGYAMFNHSSFTAGDVVVCAGMLQINAAGKMTFIDTNSGHYQPTQDQLVAAVRILRDEYQVDFGQAEVSIVAEPRVTWPAGAANLQRFLAGQPPQ